MRTTRSLSPRRDQSLFIMRLRQRHCIWRSFSDCPCVDILYDPEERDDKGELIKARHYVLLRRATLLSQPEPERFILWVTMLLFAQKQLIGSCM